MADGFQFGEYLRDGLRSYHWTPWKLGLNGVAALFIVGGIAVGAIVDKNPDTSTQVASRDVSGVPASKSDLPNSDFPTSDLPVTGALPEGDGSSALLPRIDIDTGGDPETPDASPTNAPIEPPPTTTPQDPGSVEGDQDWSPTLLKNGFGFFVAFSIGFALRTLFKFSTFIIGAQLIVLVVLSAVGWIDIRWDVMGAQFESTLGTIGEQFQSFETFVKGHIPTTAFSSAGLYTGLRKS